jgi:MFS family permease
MLLRDAGWTVALLVPAVFFIGLPIGCGYAAVQMIVPNQARGRVSALVLFAVALASLALGALLPGFLNDHLFHDEYRVGASIALTVACACVVGILAGTATLSPYRSAYRALV